MELPNDRPDSCGSACPHCLDVRSEYIMKVKREGICEFLAETFIKDSLPDTFPSLVLKKLKAFPDVGKSIYNRPRSCAPPEPKYLQSTLFQLIASGIIKIVVGEDSKARLSLKLEEDNFTPVFLNDLYWKDFDLVIDD